MAHIKKLCDTMELNHNFKPEPSFSKFLVLHLEVRRNRITSMVTKLSRRTTFVDHKGLEPLSYLRSFDYQQSPIVGCYGIEP